MTHLSQVLGVRVDLAQLVLSCMATGYGIMHKCTRRRILQCWTRDSRVVVDRAAVRMVSRARMVDRIHRALSAPRLLRADHLLQGWELPHVRPVCQPKTRNWNLGKWCLPRNRNSL